MNMIRFNVSRHFSVMCRVLALVFCAAFVSCAKDRADEKTLLLYAKASSAYALGNYFETTELLSAVNNFVPALTLKGKALYFLGDAAAAETAFRKTLRLNPASVEASLFLARLLRDSGRDDEARRAAEALIRDNPQEIRALRLASDLASAGGDSESAAAFLDQAVEASAESALVFIDRARLRWVGGNGEGAMEDLRRAEALLPWDTALSRGIRELRFLIASESEKTPETGKTPETEQTKEEE
jgi:tetratricopeptide (TPR) repeat protein